MPLRPRDEPSHQGLLDLPWSTPREQCLDQTVFAVEQTPLTGAGVPA